MIRFVDLTEALGAGPACAIYDTVVDRFDQRGDGSHCLENLDDVREAAGERGVALVPAGFFDAPEALSPENQARVEAWPAAFLNELRLRFEHLPACNVNAEFATLATRVSQNSRPTWATAAFTAVPTAT